MILASRNIIFKLNSNRILQDVVNGEGLMTNQIFNEIINGFKGFEQVKSIAVGGSKSSNMSDGISDIDTYIFTDKEIPVKSRLELIKKYSSKYEVGCEYFGAGDEFLVDKMGQQLDVMYFDKNWIESNMDNVWRKHYSSNGYTTCFLYTIKNCESIYDKEGWLEGLKEELNNPYPENLKRNIIKRNLMLLKDKPFASYYEQIEKAVKRKDLVSINHRLAAFMASYFDIIFANNELLHPGEKRLVKYAKDFCKVLPENFEDNINSLFTKSGSDLLEILEDMVLKLKKLL